jgi:DNA-binding NarL/FixJ family response regulator
MMTESQSAGMSDFVLIVDDVPDNLSLLHDALEESGYAVLVATDGESALVSARQTMPSIILLDALMPGMDGFEVCRKLTADIGTRHIPVVFMTGLSESEHVVNAFEAGGADYVTKPVRPSEVLARIATHVQSSRLMSQARSALDAFGRATISVSTGKGSLEWQTPLARSLLGKYGVTESREAMDKFFGWLRQSVALFAGGQEAHAHTVVQGAGRLVFRLFELTEDNECLVVLHEESDVAQIEALILALQLTQREAEVLYWVIRGKTNRDIGDIIGMSPRTVNKHLEHVFKKLNVETRTAAAAFAMSKVRSLKPPAS